MDDDPFKKIDKLGIELLAAFLFGISIIVISNVAFGQQWVQKPVQCGELAEVIALQENEGLIPLLAAKGHARVDDNMVGDLGYLFYYNAENQYWSMIEIFREDYACVVAQGDALTFTP